MRTILVKDLFSSAFSESKAVILRNEIQYLLDQNDNIIIDFTGITKYTTLFFNFSTGYFVSLLGPKEYDKKIRLIGLSDLGESTYRSSYDNAIEKYSPEKHDVIFDIIENPKE